MTKNQRRRKKRPRTRTRPKRKQGKGRQAKPKRYSQLTWRERKELEEQAAREGEAADVDGPDVPRDAEGNVLPGVRLTDCRPVAPHNTTQVRRGRRCCCVQAVVATPQPPARTSCSPHVVRVCMCVRPPGSSSSATRERSLTLVATVTSRGSVGAAAAAKETMQWCP